MSEITDSRPFLITGATGYVGGELARELLQRGVKVRALCRSKEKGRKLAELGGEIAIGDLRDADSLSQACQGVRGVYHIGAVYREAKFPDEYYFDVNTEGTRRIFEAAITNGVPRLIHCSTGGVLGDCADGLGSDKTPYNPGDVYQRSKVDGEKIALEFYRSGRIRGVVIRPAMIYGPRDTRHLKLFKMIAEEKFFYVGPGRSAVHFINIEDLVNAFQLAMEHVELNGNIYSIAGETVSNLKDAVERIADHLKVRRPWIHLPTKPVQWAGSICEAICKPFNIEPPIFRRRVDFFTKNRRFDISKAKLELGFKPRFSFEEEIRYVTDWYQQNGWI